MAFTPGGRADKFGNHYESLWVAARLVDLLAGFSIRSVTVEAIGEREEGVDLWCEDFDGYQFAEQCKARNASKDKWTISDLKNVILRIPQQITKENKVHFKLVTPLPFTLLEDLCFDAQASEDSEAYYHSIVLSSKDKTAVFNSFCNVLQLNESVPTDRSQAYIYLKRFSIECFSDNSRTMDDLKQKASLMFSGSPESLVSLLRTYIIDEKMLGKQIKANDLLSYLEKNSYFSRNIVADERVFSAITSLNHDFDQSISRLLIDRRIIRRTETQQCYDALEHSDVVIIHGEAGKGKSGVLYELIQKFKDNRINYLALKLDRKIPRGSSRKFGQDIGLPDSPVLCIGKSSGNSRSVLVLDQLDAIRWTSENSLEGMEVCKQMIREVSAYNKFDKGDLKLIVVCRTYDLDNDPEIKSCLKNFDDGQKTFKVEIKSLSEADVQSVVREQYSRLTQAQIRILSIPQNLYMWQEIKNENAIAFNSTADLMKIFWDYKRYQVEQNGVSAEDFKNALKKVTRYLEANGLVSAPERILNEESVKVVNALLSHSILQNQKGRLMFCHQSYFDYLVALDVLNEIDLGGNVLNWLGSKEKQTLFRRQQLSIFLFLLCKESKDNFARTAKDIINSPDIRFHMKHLVLEVFSQMRELESEYTSFLDSLLLDSEWEQHVLKASIIGNPIFVKHIVENGTVLNWLESNLDSNVSNCIWLLRSVVKEIPNTCYGVLSLALENDLLTIEQIYKCLSIHIVDDSEDLFGLRLNLINKGIDPEYVDWKSLVNGKPFFAIRLLKQLVDIENRISSDEGHIKNRKTERFLEPISHLASEHFERVWDCFYSSSVYLLTRGGHGTSFSWRSEFDVEKLYPKRDSYLDCYSELSLILFVEAGITMAEKDPEMLFNKTISFQKDNLLAKFYHALPLRYSDHVIEWLIANYSRFELGLDYERPKWMLAADLIKRFSPLCRHSLFVELENYLYSFTPKTEEFKMEYKYRVQSARGGYYFPAWGEAQHFLLPSLDDSRISTKTRLLIEVLSRKFRQYPLSSFYRDCRVKGGMIGSKLDPRIGKISDNAWRKIITNTAIPKNHDCFSWEQVKPDVVHATSHNQFSGTLERAAKINPKRFCSVFKTLPESIDASYVSSMLRALTLKIPEENGADTFLLKDWQKAEISDILEFWQKYRSMKFDRNVAVSFCRLIQNRSEEAWPPLIINDLIELATQHGDPEQDTLNVSKNGETFKDASIDSLRSTAINSVRGVSVEAIGSLLWNHKNLICMIDTHWEEILNDSHPSVLMAAHSIVLPVINIDKEKAIEWFFRLCDREKRGLCTHEAIEFVNYTINTRDVRIIKIIRSMITSECDEIRKLGAEMVTFYTHCYDGIFKDELELILNGDLSLRMGIIKAAKNLIDRDNDFDEARVLLANFFDDPDKEARDKASHVFCNDDFLNSEENVKLAHLFLKSKAFVDNYDDLLHCVTGYKSNLLPFKGLILGACEAILCNKQINESYCYYDRDLVSLLSRLYDLSNNDAQLRDRCLDIWDLFFKENIGFTREVTKELSK